MIKCYYLDCFPILLKYDNNSILLDNKTYFKI